MDLMETVDHHHIFPNGYVAKNPLNLLLVADNITNIMMASFSCPRRVVRKLLLVYLSLWLPRFCGGLLCKTYVRPRSNISSYTICMQQ